MAPRIRLTPGVSFEDDGDPVRPRRLARDARHRPEQAGAPEDPEPVQSQPGFMQSGVVRVSMGLNPAVIETWDPEGKVPGDDLDRRMRNLPPGQNGPDGMKFASSPVTAAGYLPAPSRDAPQAGAHPQPPARTGAKPPADTSSATQASKGSPSSEVEERPDLYERIQQRGAMLEID